MPEGDTIYRSASAQHQAMAGRTLVAVRTVHQGLERMLPSRLVGQTVDRVEARGKHMLHWFAPSGFALHTHMRMTGSWHSYRPGARWSKPAALATVVLAAEDVEAVGFSVPVVELLSPAQVERHRQLSRLGPDPLAAGPGGPVDLVEARARMDARPDDPIGVAILDQRVIAGVGNVYKNELLYMLRLDPWQPVRDVPPEMRDRLLMSAAAYLQANIAHGGTARILTRSPAAVARLRGRDADVDGLHVYGRVGQPCLRCDTPISSASLGDQARLTFWCTRCQGPGPGRRPGPPNR